MGNTPRERFRGPDHYETEELWQTCLEGLSNCSRLLGIVTKKPTTRVRARLGSRPKLDRENAEAAPTQLLRFTEER